MTGRFVWHDLMTLDADKACPFYVGLFGWNLKLLEMGPFKAWLIESGGQLIGSVVPEKGIPSSHWMSYMGVDDPDGACAKTAELGGKVCMKPGDVPRFGRFGIVSDPQGATFAVIRRVDGSPPPPAPGPGVFVWDELLTTDPEAAARFYGDLLGWKVARHDMGGQGYWLADEGARMCGMVQLPVGAAAPPNWLPYIGSADPDASAARAEELGGKVFAPPQDIPGVGRFAVLADPNGAFFAVFRGNPRPTE